MKNRLIIALAAAAACACALRAADRTFLKLKENDRVAFIGDALIERDIAYNYLETELSIHFHGRGITFRNIGWSGDTVWGESRAVFGSQKEGYSALIRIVGEIKPTVAFLNYGMNESFAGAAGLTRFEQGYNTLLDDVSKQAPNVRVVLISPIAFQADEAPPPAAHLEQNKHLKLYADAVKAIAQKRGALFIDMFERFGGEQGLHKQSAQTSDGLHLTAAGYQAFARGVEEGMGLKNAPAKFNVPAGIYDRAHPSASDAQSAPVEKLRELIAAKNLQFFNRWRPQNETYLFLFRKHEQGKNAKEIPEFDPIIAAKETEIAKLAAEIAK
jgi:lysophospholipase L1-like esterase